MAITSTSASREEADIWGPEKSFRGALQSPPRGCVIIAEKVEIIEDERQIGAGGGPLPSHGQPYSSTLMQTVVDWGMSGMSRT